MTAIVADRERRTGIVLIAVMRPVLRMVCVRLAGLCRKAMLAERHGDRGDTLERQPQGDEQDDRFADSAHVGSIARAFRLGC